MIKEEKVIKKIKNPKLLRFIEDKLGGIAPVFIELDLPNPKVIMSKRQFGNMRNQFRPVDFLTTNIDKNMEKEYKRIVEHYLTNNFKWLKAAHTYFDLVSSEDLLKIALLDEVKSIKMTSTNDDIS